MGEQALINGIEKLLDSREAAEILSVHPRTLQRWCDEGRFKCLWAGTRRRFRGSEILKIAESGIGQGR
jgi:excisionase family DNA binding protein